MQHALVCSGHAGPMPSVEEGQPIVAAVAVELAGTINLSATGEQWKPFTSRQRVVTRRPGFPWD